MAGKKKDSQTLRTENVASYLEFQLKFPTNITETDLLAQGAKRLGSVVHEDKYFLRPQTKAAKNASEDPQLVRVRRENGNALNCSYRQEVTHIPGKPGSVITSLDDMNAGRIEKTYTHVLDINKRRVIYVLNGVIINYDVVEPLGTYVELVVSKEKDYDKLLAVARKLNLPLHISTSQTYFQLGYTQTDTMQKLLASFTSSIGRFSFGIASGVLTTVGLIIVMNTSVVSLLAVIAGIVGIAVADSMSDAFGVYSLKKSERGTSPRNAIGAALATFLGKLICTTTFIVPFIMAPPAIAVWICIVWGLVLLVLVNVEIALVQQESIWKTVLTNLILAGIVMVLSYGAGTLLAPYGG